ncbi:MAG: DUF1330 domain-containing protein [Proteobacteria bacterium]|nr:DUF1330 domain-containing protein [Pseudomonadota bacterium]
MKTINPDPAALPGILAKLPVDVPIVMVNLLRFRDRAIYPDGKSDCTGREAYKRYSMVALKKLKEIGAQAIFMAGVKGSLIAPPDEVWDEVLLVRYPSIQAFSNMLAMKDYRDVTVHRSAALEDSRLIATVEHVAGS